MAYTKTTFNPGAAPGISADELNKIGDGIAAAATTADAALPKAGGTITGTLNNTGIYQWNGTTMAQTRVVGSGVNSRVQFLEGGVWREVGNLFDKTAMQSLFSPSTQVSGLTFGTYTTALSITGKGYLDQFIFSTSTDSIYNNVRITVDGVQKVVTGGNLMVTGFASRQVMNAGYGGSLLGGLTTSYAISSGGSNTIVAIQANDTIDAAYPNTAGIKRLVIASDSIYFTSSLLVEVKSGASGQTGTGYAHYSGGYI